MRTTYFFMLPFLVFCNAATAQNNPTAPDTLIIEPVIGDPISMMLTEPSGTDLLWVNFDEELGVGQCVSDGGDTPLGWYIERDFGFLNPEDTENDCFTSCSYLDGGIRNHNWLILPPIFVPDSTYLLCWRSLVTEGPAFTDGYKVLASTASNLPSSGDFSNVLFKAAETLRPVIPGVYTLNPADYLFSSGYLHANGFTDTNYFFLLPPNGPLRGRLEPHCVSLAAFAGQSVYLAFHHDSEDDSQLQLDDILVSNDRMVGIQNPSNILAFNIIPNPASSSTFVQWKMQKPEAGRMTLVNLAGKIVLEKDFSAYEQGQLFLQLESLAAGVYQCVLQTPSGHATRKLVKL